MDAQEAEDGELEDKQEKTEDRTQRIRSSDTGASSDANEESEEESGYERLRFALRGLELERQVHCVFNGSKLCEWRFRKSVA